MIAFEELCESNLFTVKSETRKDVTYVVDLTDRSCTCPGFKYRGSCKHLRAVTEKEEASDLRRDLSQIYVNIY